MTKGVGSLCGRYVFCQKPNGPTQLLNATFKDKDIDDRQIKKYQPSVTSRVIFHHLIPLIMIKY